MDFDVHSFISLSCLLRSSNCFFLIKLLRASRRRPGRVNVRMLMWYQIETFDSFDDRLRLAHCSDRIRDTHCHAAFASLINALECDDTPHTHMHGFNECVQMTDTAPVPFNLMIRLYFHIKTFFYAPLMVMASTMWISYLQWLSKWADCCWKHGIRRWRKMVYVWIQMIKTDAIYHNYISTYGFHSVNKRVNEVLPLSFAENKDQGDKTHTQLFNNKKANKRARLLNLIELIQFFWC